MISEYSAAQPTENLWDIMYKCDLRRNFLWKKLFSIIRNTIESDKKNTKYSHEDKNSEKRDRADSQDYHVSVQTSMGGQGQSHRAFGQVYIKWSSEMTLERSVSSRNRHKTGKKNMSILVVWFFFFSFNIISVSLQNLIYICCYSFVTKKKKPP